MISEDKQICNQRDFLYSFLKKKFPKVRNEDLEDTVQITLIKAVRRKAQRNKNYSVRTWLATIAVNTYYDMFRKPYIKREVVGTSNDEGDDYLLNNIFEDDFSETYCHNEHLSELCKILLSDLENNHNISAFTMNCIDDIDYKEIAIIQNVPLGTVKSRVFRGKKLLQEKYAHLKLAYQD